MRFSRAVILTVLSCGLVACATAGQRTWRGPQGQTCRESPTTERDVDLTSLLQDSYVTAPVASPHGPDTPLVSVLYDSVGALSRIRTHARPGVIAGRAGVDQELRGRFAPTARPRSHAYGLFVRDGEPDLRAHQVREECEPELLNQREIARQLEFLGRELSVRETGVVVWLFVAADGQVLDAIINRSSGDIGTDQAMNRIARQARLAPALLDGFAVPVWIALPLRIRAQPKFLRPGECPPPEVQSIPCVQ